MATNNGTLGVQNNAYTYSSNNNNTSILITISRGSIIVKSGIINKQAAYIGKNSDDAYGQFNNNESDRAQNKQGNQG